MSFDPSEFVKKTVGTLVDKQKYHFRLEWEGSKVPRGTKIGNVEIGSTRDGIVSDKMGNKLGYYEREVEFGGDTGKKHVIKIGTSHADITPLEGGKVELISNDRQL